MVCSFCAKEPGLYFLEKYWLPVSGSAGAWPDALLHNALYPLTLPPGKFLLMSSEVIIVLWLFQGQMWDISTWNLPLRIINALCCSAWMIMYKETKWLCSAGVWLSAKMFPNNQTVVDGKWCNANICRCKIANN